MWWSRRAHQHGTGSYTGVAKPKDCAQAWTASAAVSRPAYRSKKGRGERSPASVGLQLVVFSDDQDPAGRRAEATRPDPRGTPHSKLQGARDIKQLSSREESRAAADN